ncbi:neurotensin receptor type 1-like [Gigantopelta aegis]|uniref:neurotensin receptor type 1-like n=1 Tax=Gigantopelta aegis TaxID=1735272 RepID=UPI001B88A73C|nr:neurotensin receptor type 1-like [Gigantopelta aegis]
MNEEYTADISLVLPGLAQESTTQVNGSSGCLSSSDIVELVKLWAENPDMKIGNSSGNCSSLDMIGWLHNHTASKPAVFTIGRQFYAYFTPMIMVIGIIGNSLSLNVFLSKNMRSLSASTYLAALSTSDLLALVFYVMIEWLIRGIPVLYPDKRVTFMHVDGVCQMIMYLHYVSRFLSAWLVVAFTVERYIGVCHPLRRRDICTITSTRRIVLGLVIVSLILNVFKPTLSIVSDVKGWGRMCTTKADYRHLSFILDSIFAVMITLVPFVIITCMNLLIVRKLVLRNKRQRACKVITEESIIRLEFTLILLAVSLCFIVFNIPYFVTWCKLFLTSKFIHLDTFQDVGSFEYFQGTLWITRAIFYINYCINFFLYSITGTYFRRELKMFFFYRSRKYQTYTRCTRLNSTNSHTSHTPTPAPQSWV